MKDKIAIAIIAVIGVIGAIFLSISAHKGKEPAQSYDARITGNIAELDKKEQAVVEMMREVRHKFDDLPVTLIDSSTTSDKEGYSGFLKVKKGSSTYYMFVYYEDGKYHVSEVDKNELSNIKELMQGDDGIIYSRVNAEVS